MSNGDSRVIGIDVGGAKKGFHAVALRNGHYWSNFTSRDAAEISNWCLQQDVQAVGVDAPCRWSRTGRARYAERQLAKKNALVEGFVHCFATPTKEAALSHPKNYYGWMLNGAVLFQLLERHYQLYLGQYVQDSGRVCFETFPQASACALAGQIISAKHKSTTRRELLRGFGIDTSRLANIDTVDAALCAITAHYYLSGRFKAYGDAAEGFIVVPALKK